MLLQHYNYLNLSFQPLPVYASYFNLLYNLLSHPTPSIMLLKFKFIFLSSSDSHSQGLITLNFLKRTQILVMGPPNCLQKNIYVT